MPWRSWLLRVPVLIGAGLLLGTWAHLAWNATAGAIDPWLHLRIRFPFGFVQSAAPVPSVENLLDGSYQQAVARRLGMFTMLNHSALRWRNQFYYSLLGMSGTSSIVVGRDGQLIERTYIDEYCARDMAEFAPRAAAWSREIRRLQDAVEARGKTFLYVITPSKAAVYPEYLPPDMPCRSDRADRRGKLPAYRAALDRSGVHYVDTATRIAEERHAFPIDLYPRGGIHWNLLGATLGAQQVIDALDRLHPGGIGPLDYSFAISHEPKDEDRDLYEILNRALRDDRYPVPIMSYAEPSPEQVCHRVRIAEVAGSFIFRLNEALAHAACRPEIRTWFYWDMKAFEYPEGTYVQVPVDAAERNRALLTDADIVILEENEASLPRTDHGKHLMEMMAQQATASLD